MPKVRVVVVLAGILMLLLAQNTVFAANDAQVNESLGPEGYGWQQVYINTTPYAGAQPMFFRLTVSSDRRDYDYDYKKIQIWIRAESYFSRDCGWWYVSGTPPSFSITIADGSNNTVNTTSLSSTTRGAGYINYSWSDLKYKPGAWRVRVSNSSTITGTNKSLAASFLFYVRGQLNVTNVYTNVTSGVAGSPINVNATVKDHNSTTINSSYKDNTGKSVAPTVTMYVSGGNYSYSTSMSGNGQNWTATFTPPSQGDYYITIKAGDGTIYWIDGRNSTKISVGGTFYASFGYGGLISTAFKIALMIIFAFALRRKI